jgi:transcriptional regulator with XRE-family HTH domain
MSKKEELRKLIDAAGYKPYILSLKMGYTQSVVYGWLSDRREPCARDMIRLAEILDTPIEKIVRIFGED